MPIMMNIENFWLVMAIDPDGIDKTIDRIVGRVETNADLDGLSANLIGMYRPTVELMHAEMAILYPNWEVIGFWRLSDLIVDKLTKT